MHKTVWFLVRVNTCKQNAPPRNQVVGQAEVGPSNPSPNTSSGLIFNLAHSFVWTNFVQRQDLSAHYANAVPRPKIYWKIQDNVVRELQKAAPKLGITSVSSPKLNQFLK